MTTKPIRVFSINLTGTPEFYATTAYKIIGDGLAEMTGKTHDVTGDIEPYLDAAKVGVVKDLIAEIEFAGIPHIVALTEDAVIAWLRAHIVIEETPS